jgi:hypothetical protein
MTCVDPLVFFHPISFNLYVFQICRYLPKQKTKSRLRQQQHNQIKTEMMSHKDST